MLWVHRTLPLITPVAGQAILEGMMVFILAKKTYTLDEF